MAHAATTASTTTVLTQVTAYTAEETGGAAATIYLRDTSGAGTILWRIHLNAYATEGESFGGNPLELTVGKSFYIDITGTASVTLHGR